MPQSDGRRPELARFAERLPLLRRAWSARHPNERPMTQERLAEATDVDARTVRDWEAGRHRPRHLRLAERIAESLEVSVEQICLPEPIPWRPLPITAGAIIELSSRMAGPPEPGALVGLSEERIEIALGDTIQRSPERACHYTVRVVDRRTFLSLALVLPVSLTAKHLDALGMAVSTSRVDSAAAEGLARMAVACARASEEVPARELMPHVQWQIRFLGQLQATSVSLQPRVTAVLGSMLALAGDMSLWQLSDSQQARRYLQRALAAADEAGDRALSGYVLGSLAYVTAYGDRDLLGAVRTAVESQEVAATGASHQSRARSAGIAAEMLANAGDERGYQRSLDSAQVALSGPPDDESLWVGGPDFDPVRLRWQECWGSMQFGKPEAVEGLQWVRGHLPSEGSWSMCVVTADIARALVQRGEIVEGCAYAEETLSLATRFGHGESIRRVKTLCRNDLRPHADHSAVRALVDRVMEI